MPDPNKTTDGFTDVGDAIIAAGTAIGDIRAAKTAIAVFLGNLPLSVRFPITSGPMAGGAVTVFHLPELAQHVERMSQSC